MSDPGFRMAAFGDFLVRVEPTLLHGLVGHREGATVAELPCKFRRLFAAEQRRPALTDLTHFICGDAAGCDDTLHHVIMTHTWRDFAVWHAKQFA
jgi:hypothetical protein